MVHVECSINRLTLYMNYTLSDVEGFGFGSGHELYIWNSSDSSGLDTFLIEFQPGSWAS